VFYYQLHKKNLKKHFQKNTYNRPTPGYNGHDCWYLVAITDSLFMPFTCKEKILKAAPQRTSSLRKGRSPFCFLCVAL